MTTIKLTPTRQKSYYNKAIIMIDDDFIVLRSYNTDVIAIDKRENKIIRLWNGWSKTTSKHINDFLMLYGFKPLSKKEWLDLPCINNEPTYNIYISNGWYTYKSPALLTARECENRIEQIKSTRLVVWYE